MPVHAHLTQILAKPSLLSVSTALVTDRLERLLVGIYMASNNLEGGKVHGWLFLHTSADESE